MLCDFYELTMANGYFACGKKEEIAYFDLFYRRNPDQGGFAIAAGLEQVIHYVKNLHFSPENIDFLRKKGQFSEDFLQYLADFRFTGDIWAVPEGTPVFPNEPLLTVRAPAIETQFIETYLLLAINHQTLIATKANRIARAAKGRSVMEFGTRRAQGASAAVLGARAAYIGGVRKTACPVAEEQFGIPAVGTMAHSWIQMFDSEYEAFKTYCEIYPNNATLLVDTYNTLESGIPNAIRAFKETGLTDCAIRIDSGDLCYLSRKARKMLDEAGLPQCRIVVSNSLDEFLIGKLIEQGACIDAFGVGERLITAKSDPVFGGVYKLVAVEEADGAIIPKIKISDNPEKVTNPHFKKVWRLYEAGKAVADLLTLHDETIDTDRPLEIFDPEYTWKRKTLTEFEAKELLVPIFRKGELVYQSPSLAEIAAYCDEQVALQWDEVKRFDNPHNYYVDLSQNLWDLKHDLLKEKR
mgnify:FL=1